jgi:hypothetical protein
MTILQKDESETERSARLHDQVLRQKALRNEKFEVENWLDLGNSHYGKNSTERGIGNRKIGKATRTGSAAKLSSE